MSLVVAALRHAVRRHRLAIASVGLVVAVGCGVTLSAFIAAYRTDRAHPDYLIRARAADLVVNPDLTTRSMDRELRRLPGIAEVHSDNLMVASVERLRPTSISDARSDPDIMLQIRGSTDGQYLDADRPIVTEGRFADGPHEVFVTEDERAVLEARLGHRLSVGDQLDVAFWWSLLLDTELPPDTEVSPIGVEHLRIAGFGRLSDEVLPDDLYPRQRLIVSGDVARRYACDGDLRPDMTMEEAVDSLFPQSCSRSHRIYSLHLDPGVTVSDVQNEFDELSTRLAGDVPSAAAEQGITYAFHASDTGATRRAVRDVTRPTVTSLRVFGAVTAAATLAAAVLAIWRLLRRGVPVLRDLRALGATPRQRAAFAAGPAALAAGVGVAVAIPIAAIGSITGPLGSIRAVDPSPGISLPGRLTLVVVASALVLLTASVAGLARHVARAAGDTEISRHRRVRSASSFPPPVALGVRSALGGRTSDGGPVVVAGAAIVIATTVAAVTFGANLGSLVSHPQQYGWPWDAAVVTNGGYRSTDPGLVRSQLADDPAVVSYGLFALDAGASIGRHTVPSLLGYPGAESTSLELARGRSAQRPGEAVLGVETARELGADLGDRVSLATTVTDATEVTVVGVGLLPEVGQFLAGRPGLGTGAMILIDEDPTDSTNDFPAALTAISLRPGSDVDGFVQRLRSAPSWDSSGAAPWAVLTTVRPAAIVNADASRSGPLVLSILLGAGLVIGLAWSVGLSVRERRREFAVLRALGLRQRDIRISIAVHAATVMVVGICIGMLVGLFAGSAAWRAYAGQVDVLTTTSVPWAWLAVIVASAVVIAGLSAVGPIIAAGNRRPSDELRAR